MRRSSLIVLSALLAGSLAGAQPSNYKGYHQDPNEQKTFGSDIGIMEVFVESKDAPRGSQAIVIPQNGAFDIVLNVENHSDFPSVAYRIQAIQSVERREKRLDVQSGGTLRGKEKRQHRWHIVADKAGTCDVQFQLQLLGTPVGGAGQDNPANNAAVLGYTVTPGAGGPGGGGRGMPDLVVDGYSATNEPAFGKTILEIRVGNKGDADVPGSVEVQLEVAGRKTSVRTSGGVPKGQTAFARYELMTELWQKNPTCKIVVDPGNRIKENDETNNAGK